MTSPYPAWSNSREGQRSRAYWTAHFAAQPAPTPEPVLYSFVLKAGVEPKLDGRTSGTATKDQIRAWVAEIGVSTVRYLISIRAFRLRVGPAMRLTAVELPGSLVYGRHARGENGGNLGLRRAKR